MNISDQDSDNTKEGHDAPSPAENAATEARECVQKLGAGWTEVRGEPFVALPERVFAALLAQAEAGAERMAQETGEAYDKGFKSGLAENARRRDAAVWERNDLRALLERILDHAAAGYAEHQARRSAHTTRAALTGEGTVKSTSPVPVESLLDNEDYEVMKED